VTLREFAQIPDRYRLRLLQVAAAARAAFPQAHRQIDRAIALILAGHVVILARGHARVQEQADPARIYDVRGHTCTCPEAARRPQGTCTHVMATWLVQRTQQGPLYRGRLEAPAEAEAPATTQRCHPRRKHRGMAAQPLLYGISTSTASARDGRGLRDMLCTWRGMGNGWGTWESTCRLRLYTRPDRAVVIATELPENSGTSITTAADHLATWVTYQYALHPEHLCWIEHYPAGLESAASYDLVTFAWDGIRFSQPRWRRVAKAAVEALVGEPV
jgi:hypothetical protein